MQAWFNFGCCICNQIEFYWMKLQTRYWFGACWNFHWKLICLTLQQSFDLAYSVLVAVSVIAFLHLMLCIFRMANKLLGNKIVMSLSFSHASTPSKMLQVYTCSVGISCSTLKGPFGTVLRCYLRGACTGRTTVSWGTNIQIILRSWVVFVVVFFFFKTVTDSRV